MMKFVKNQKQRAHNRERRRFLDMIARTGVSTALLKASPFALGMFASRFASAQDATNKRTVFMYLPNGAPNGLWMPTGQNNMNLCTRAYAPVAQYCEFHEVNMTQGGHGTTHNSMAAYGSANRNDTLDSTLASENFPTAPYKIIRAGVQNTGGPSFCREAGQQATHIRGPAALYKAIFSGSPPPNNNDDSYKRVFEMNRYALSNLQKKLGVDEYQRFETHLESLNEIERSIEAANAPREQGEECLSPAISPYESEHIVDEGKAASDIIIAALKCGLTNVATIMLSDDQAGWLAGERGLEYGLTNLGLNHHNYSHSGNDTNTGNMVGLLSEVPAYFIEELAKNDGPDGQPLINTTVFVQVTDMGDGDHGLANAPFIAASAMNGFGYKTSRGAHQSFMAELPSRMGLAGTL